LVTTNLSLAHPVDGRTGSEDGGCSSVDRGSRDVLDRLEKVTLPCARYIRRHIAFNIVPVHLTGSPLGSG
jgi:hypothetical protein